MAATHGDPPAVARQRVRRALRRFRDATPLSQGDVAKKLGWSLSKVQRIESGEVTVSTTDLRALLELYGVPDRSDVEPLIEDARSSRRQRYVTTPEYREHLTPGLIQLMQFEMRARMIKAYQPIFYPGILQTPAVAGAILDWWKGSLDEAARRVRLEVRMRRRRQLMQEPDAPEYFLILDESVIRRRVVSAEVTAEQLDMIAGMAQQPHVHIRLVPFSKGAYISTLGGFQILTMADGDCVLYREGYLRDELIHEPDEVEFHKDAFENLWNQSLSESATLRTVLARAARFRASIDEENAE